MPIYEYRCTGCDEAFEVLQGVNERQKRTCEKCGGKLEKMVSRTSFQLKGGGWYSEGYGSSGKTGGESKKPAEKPTEKPAKKTTKKDKGSSSS
ncbi:MAG: zinc ribbon domain-containing protein [Acidobacteriota bacterium]|nr:zinc ribbon domain-containing protein [Acidobacteriota bacterium]MDH3784005.1 zinc ribbon domain-containing protein [Acidobacteriota bacterium]